MIITFDKKTISIPLYCHEVTASDYEDLQADRRKLKKAIGLDLKMTEEEIAEKYAAGEMNELTNDEYLVHLIAICSNVCEGLEHLVGYLPEDSERDLIKENFIIRIGQNIPLSVERVYAHLLNMFQNYQPEVSNFDQYILEWFDTKMDGKTKFKQTYLLNSTGFNKVLSGNSFTSGEIIEALEFERLLGKKIKETMDLDGNLSFTLSMHQLAIFLRPKGISLPSKPRARSMFLTKYQNIFQDVPVNVVFDIGFFLTSSFKNYVQIEISNSSLKKKSKVFTVK